MTLVPQPLKETPDEHWVRLVRETEEAIEQQMTKWCCDREYVVTLGMREFLNLDKKARPRIRRV